LNVHWASNCKNTDNVRFERDVEGFMLTATEFASRAEPLLGATRKAELGEVVVFTDNRSDAASILEYVFTQPAPAITLPQEFARGAGVQEVIETHQSQIESIEGRHRARFGDVVRRHRIPQSEWRSFSQWSTSVL
jgi:hypothetical protein